MIPFPTPTADQLAAENVVLTQDQQESFDLTAAFGARGMGYFAVQSTKARFLPLSQNREDANNPSA